MDKRSLLASLTLTALTLMLLCAALAVSTYAWFTFDPYTNITPMEGKISDGDTNLLICETKDGKFDVKCGLHPTAQAELLQPVSTLDLSNFYTATAQNREGISVKYKDVTEEPEKWLIQGTVYLQSLGAGSDVYFDMDTLKLGEDIQVLAAGRLGLKITDAAEQSEVFLFKLDALGDTTNADSRKTVDPETEVVVGGINEDGTPKYEDDPAVSIGDYTLAAADPKKLCAIGADEIARVDYWLYLEGCDEHCSNPVQSRDVTLTLGFEGAASGR